MSKHRHKYQHTRGRIMDMVESLEVGDALPPERSLCEAFEISRVTLRRALDELAREGYLVRRQGSGTFVARPKVTQPLTLSSFSEDMRRRGLEPGGRVLSTGRVSAGARLGRRMDVSPETGLLEVARLRLADGEPMAIETLYSPLELLPGIREGDLKDSSFYALLQERYGVEIGSGVQTIEPTVTNEEESQALQVPPRSPAFLFERTTRSAGGEVVEFVRSVYRGDRYKIMTELPPPGEPASVTVSGTSRPEIGTGGEGV